MSRGAVQTRRDQLQAYRFQNRRALAALVTGRPNVLEPPMRRLTVTTLSGIMIAILIAIGFGVVALVRPSAGDSWKAAGAVIVDQDDNSTYVYTDGTLHPVLNYTSAVLAVSATNAVSRVQVSSSDIAGANYGYEIGIPSIPYALPPQNSLISYPLSVCSVAQRTSVGGATAQVSLHVGGTGASSAVPAAQALLVVAAAGDDSQPYLLYDGRRLALGSQQVQSTLGFNAQPVPVGTAFLDSVPLGPSLAPPHIPGALSAQTSYSIAGAPRTIGTLLQVSGTSTEYIALPTGTRLLTPLEADLFVGYPTMSVSIQDATAQTVTIGSSGDLLAGLRQLPASPPPIDSSAGARAGVCVIYDRDDTASFALTTAALPNFLAGSVGQSDVSLSGRADAVDVPATKGVLATPTNAPNTVLFISDQGIKYAFANNSLLTGFGYSSSDVVKVPPALLTLIPSGPALSTAAATARVGG